MNHRAAVTLLATLTVGALALTGCARPSAPPGVPARATPAVVASTDVYGAVATAVAGDRAAVTSIITGARADPHEYESTARDAAAAGEATVLVANGGGYDDFAGKLAESARPKPTVIDVSELSGLRAGTPAGEEFNEHVWYHLPTMAGLADRLAAELGDADPADAATFSANAAAFTSELDGLGAKLNGIKAAHPGDRVAVTEPVPGYLVEAAGLENAVPEEFTEAAEEGTDPPAAVLDETLALFRPGPGREPVRALLANPQAENAATQQVERAARDGGVPVVTMTETLPVGTTDYVAWMGGQIDELTTALDRP